MQVGLANLGQRLLSLCLLTSAGLVGIGTLLQFVLRDELPILATLFYAFPPQVGAPIALTASILWFRRKRVALGTLHFLGAGALVALLVAVGWLPGAKEDSPTPPGEGLTVMTWNLWGARVGAEQIGSKIAELAPDVAAVVEAGDLPDQSHLLGEHLPGYRVVPLSSRSMLLVKGHVSAAKSTQLGARRRLSTAIVDVGSYEVAIAVVDLHWGVWEHRKAGFETIRRKLAAFRNQHAATPLIVLGDFNTPRSSPLLTQLRGDLVNCFEVAGIGLGFTWPAPTPLWDLDQIWVDKGWTTHSCTTPMTLASDHRPVLVQLSR
ncbi:MAG: endonuclease/exonuclease/phosphatase family protein [Planctomycetota bacterium]